MERLPPTESWPTKPARMVAAVADFAAAGVPVGIRWSSTCYGPRGTVLRVDWHSPVPAGIGIDTCSYARCMTVYPVSRELAGPIRRVFAEQVLLAAVSYLQASDQQPEGWKLLQHARWWMVEADGHVHTEACSGRRGRSGQWTPDC